MPIRDHVVSRLARIRLGIKARFLGPSARFICPDPDQLAAAMLTEDDWWATLQAADDQYVQIALALNWDQAAQIARSHSAVPDGTRAFSSGDAASALEDAAPRLLWPALLAAGWDQPNTFPWVDWWRVVLMAEGHWLQRHRGTPDEQEWGVTVDAEALREAFLSVDSEVLYGCAPIAPRRRDMRAFRPAPAEQQ